MIRSSTRALALTCSLLLLGCATLSGETEEYTQLKSEAFPVHLGRILEVELKDVEDDQVRAELLKAIEREFVSRNLFERVREVEVGAEPTPFASRIRIVLQSSSLVELFDLFNLESAYIARFELEIELEDERRDVVLEGHISGIGVDSVTEEEFLDDEKRMDVRIAALHDAAMKMSRALRRAADTRGDKKMESLPQVALPSGVGIVVLGFDDDETAQHRLGPAMSEHLTQGLERLGPSFQVVSRSEMRRALERAERKSKIGPPWFDLPDYKLKELSPHLPMASLFVVGKVTQEGGELIAEAKLLTQKGVVLATVERSKTGLGALRVVAALLAEGLGEAIGGLKRKKS